MPNDLADWQSAAGSSLPPANQVFSVGLLGLTQAGGRAHSSWTLRYPTVMLSNVLVSAVAQVAATEGLIQIFLGNPVAQGEFGLWEFLVVPAQPSIWTIGGVVDLSALLPFYNYPLGAVVDFFVGVTDVIGVGTYDVTISAMYAVR